MTAKKKNRKQDKSKLREYIEIIVTAVVLALIVRTFIIQSYHIPSESMQDTLLKGDFLFANKFIYGAKVPFVDWRLPALRDPKPGDVVIFKYPCDGETDYIKRCIAVEGQVVEVKNKTVYIDGEKVEEDYTKFEGPGWRRRDFGPYKVPEGCIFVMGDNRDNSKDSRYWPCGAALDKKYLRGKALFLYFSINYETHFPRFSRIGDIIR